MLDLRVVKVGLSVFARLGKVDGQVSRVKQNVQRNRFSGAVFYKDVAARTVAGVKPHVASLYVTAQKLVVFVGVAANQNQPAVNGVVQAGPRLFLLLLGRGILSQKLLDADRIFFVQNFLVGLFQGRQLSLRQRDFVFQLFCAAGFLFI